jgi:hypothetical protein
MRAEDHVITVHDVELRITVYRDISGVVCDILATDTREGPNFGMRGRTTLDVHDGQPAHDDV